MLGGHWIASTGLGFRTDICEQHPFDWEAAPVVLESRSDCSVFILFGDVRDEQVEPPIPGSTQLTHKAGKRMGKITGRRGTKPGAVAADGSLRQ